MKRTLDHSSPDKGGKKLYANSPFFERKIAAKKVELDFTLSDEKIARALADIVNDTEDLNDLDDESFRMIEEVWDDHLKLIQEKEKAKDDFYGLPKYVKKLLEDHRKITKLYEWQEQTLDRILQTNRNVIYSVPTSGGKTLVAEVMILRELLLNRKNVLFILPYISLVQEKLRSMIPFSLKCDFTLEEYAGTKGRIPCVQRNNSKSLYIATIEKAHLVLSSLIEDDRLDEIGLVVIDELHMIGDGTSRGAILESTVVKIKLAMQKRMASHLRIIGMSATLSNLNDISKFLNSDVVQKDFRPVQLHQFVKYGNIMYQFNDSNSEEEWFKQVRRLPNLASVKDPDNMRALIEEVMPSMPTLIFASTKNQCENLSILLSDMMSTNLYAHNRDKKIALLRDLAVVNSGNVCRVLKKSIPFGISYHHSGLTSDERELIEAAFLDGTINCIVCTSTLAAGINLPAQRVIIRSPYTGREFLTSSMYRQMCGRAGRAGLCDRPGESILMVSTADYDKCKQLFQPLKNSCNSSFSNDCIKSVSSLILVLIHLKLISSVKEAKTAIAEQTLFGIQSKEIDFCDIVDQAFVYLQKNKMIQFDENNQFEIIPAGKAAVKSLFDLEKCQKIFDELKIAQNGINLNTNLHLIYICTFGFNEADLPYISDRNVLMDAFMELNESEQKSAEVLGITGGTVMRFLSRGNDTIQIKRFYLTLLIYQLWQYGIEINVVSQKFRMHRGNVQSLIGQFTSQASSLLRFVTEFKEFWGLRSLMPTICERLTYCTIPELIPLMELPHVRMARAKAFFNSGLKTLEDVAKCPLIDLCRKIDRMSTRQAYDIIQFAKKKFRDRADELQTEIVHLQQIGHSVGQENLNDSKEDELPNASFDGVVVLNQK